MSLRFVSQTLCLAVVCTLTCSAQGVATVALSGVVAGKLIDQFEGTANRLLQNGSTAGDALGTKFGNELRIATRNTELALDAERNKTFEQLDQSEQSLFISMNAIISAANSAVNSAQTMEEVANVDLVEFTNRLPFTRKIDFYLSSIKGLSQIHGNSNYDIVLRGLGIGFAPGDRSYKVSVKVGGQTVDGVHLRAQSATDLIVDVPHETLEALFKDDNISFVAGELDDTITVHNTIFGFFHSDTSKTYTLPFTIVLMPRFPAILSGSELITKPSWSPTPFTTSVAVTVTDCHPNRPCDWTRTINLANDEVATNVRYSCTGQCGWDYNLRHGGYAPDFDILSDGHSVTVYRHNDGEHTTTGTYYVDYKKQATTTEAKAIATKKVNFGEQISFDLDPANTTCSYQIQGQLVTKQRPSIDSTMVQSVDGLLIKRGAAKFGDHCRVTLSLNQP